MLLVLPDSQERRELLAPQGLMELMVLLVPQDLPVQEAVPPDLPGLQVLTVATAPLGQQGLPVPMEELAPLVHKDPRGHLE